VPRYLLFHYTPAENTLFENIYKLPAAHNLIFDLEKFDFHLEKYWDIIDDEILYSDFNQAKQKLDEILNDSVKLRTETSDVAVGTFLSGGLDSSLVTALFKKYYKGDEFHTFNVVWEEKLPNESEFAQIVANHI
jgi:asparagine synthase (glutamine-hydrolysing)